MTKATKVLGGCCLAAALAAGCSSGQKDNQGKILAYIVSAESAACARHADGSSCDADTANGCSWAAPDIACRQGMSCPEGICIAQDE